MGRAEIVDLRVWDAIRVYTRIWNVVPTGDVAVMQSTIALSHPLQYHRLLPPTTGSRLVNLHAWNHFLDIMKLISKHIEKDGSVRRWDLITATNFKN